MRALVNRKGSTPNVLILWQRLQGYGKRPTANRMRETPVDTSAEKGFTEDLLCGKPAARFLSRGRQAQERSSPEPTRRKGLDQSLYNSSICESVFEG